MLIPPTGTHNYNKMKKNILLTLITLLSLSSLYGFNGIATIDGVYYQLNVSKQTAEVLPKSYSGDIIIPSSVTYYGKEYQVTSIRANAFSDCTDLSSVSIPESVTSIGSSVFSGCTGLVSVVWNAKSCGDFSTYSESPFHDISTQVHKKIISFTFGNEVEHIPAYLCVGMEKLRAITIPESVTSIGSCAFEGCTGLTSIAIPKSVTSIGYRVFSNCTGLASIAIPNSVTSIGESAFEGCAGLTSIAIPKSVTSIGYCAFSNCTSLVSVVWNAKSCGDFSTYYESPFYYVSNQITSFTLGNEVEHIPVYLCLGMNNFSSITIPNSVTSIGLGAFFGCTGLVSVVWNAKSCGDFSTYSESPFHDISTQVHKKIISFTFGNEVEHIPAYLCFRMENLSLISIPNSVKSIGSSAFSGCTGISDISIPNSVKSIGSSAFSGCTGLENVEWKVKNQGNYGDYSNSPFYKANNVNTFRFGNEVEQIPAYLCYGMEKLFSVTIPNGVTSIGSGAFSGCTGISDISIPNGVTSIGSGAFSGCTGISDISIPNGVTSIGDSAFSGCTGLKIVEWNVKNQGDYGGYSNSPFCKANNVDTFRFGSEVERIPAYLCCEMEKLSLITIPNSVTVIGRSAFEGCTGFTSVTIGNGIEYISMHAFSGCTGLTQIYLEAQTVPNCDPQSFYGVDPNIPIFVPCGTKEVYQSDHDWKLNNCIDSHKYNAIVQSSGTGSAETISYTCDNELTIQATANKHYHFTQWSDGNTDNPHTLVVFQDTTIMAVFSPDSYTISATARNGYVEGAGKFDYGTTTTLTAVADAHYHFTQWGDGNTDNPREVLVGGNSTYIANFVIDQHTISATAPNGHVEGVGKYDYGTTATLTAIANEHYHFTQWSDGNMDNPRTVSVEDNATYTAIFAPNQYTISASARNGHVEGVGKHDYGTTATISAVADDHYHFSQWGDGNTDNPREVLIGGDTVFVAEFAIDQHTIMATCNLLYGEVTGDGVYDYGTRITLTAIPNSGYVFKQWSNGLTYNPYRFTVVSDLTLEAEFVSTTPTDNPSAATTTNQQKVLIDGHVYILRNGKTYTLTGIEVR